MGRRLCSVLLLLSSATLLVLSTGLGKDGERPPNWDKIPPELVKAVEQPRRASALLSTGVREMMREGMVPHSEKAERVLREYLLKPPHRGELTYAMYDRLDQFVEQAPTAVLQDVFKDALQSEETAVRLACIEKLTYPRLARLYDVDIDSAMAQHLSDLVARRRREYLASASMWEVRATCLYFALRRTPNVVSPLLDAAEDILDQGEAFVARDGGGRMRMDAGDWPPFIFYCICLNQRPNPPFPYAEIVKHTTEAEWRDEIARWRKTIAEERRDGPGCTPCLCASVNDSMVGEFLMRVAVGSVAGKSRPGSILRQPTPGTSWAIGRRSVDGDTDQTAGAVRPQPATKTHCKAR